MGLFDKPDIVFARLFQGVDTRLIGPGIAGFDRF
jgi:hypothetical protein